MSIQFGDILKHNNLLYPIVDINDVKGGLRSIATFSSDSLISEYTSIPEKYRTGHSLLLETSTSTIYYLSGIDATKPEDWSPITPFAHNHVEADITDLDKYTQVETDDLLDSKQDISPIDNNLYGLLNGVLQNIGPLVYQDKIIALGTETKVDNVYTYQDYVWSLNNVQYTNATPDVLTIEPAEIGFKRKDISVFTNGTIEIVQGDETDGPTVTTPEVPVGTLYFKFYDIDGATIVDDPTIPIVGTEFVSKIEFKTDEDDISTGENMFILCNKGSNIVLKNSGLISIAGFNILGRSTAEGMVYQGKQFTLRNLTGNPILIKHGQIATSVERPFLTKDGLDITFPNNEMIRFDYSSDGMRDVFRSWNTATPLPEFGNGIILYYDLATDSDIIGLGGSLSKNTFINAYDKSLGFFGNTNGGGLFFMSNQPDYPTTFGSLEIGNRDGYGFLKRGLQFFSNKTIFKGDVNGGIDYDTDYSSTYTDRSLVDKQYTDSVKQKTITTSRSALASDNGCLIKIKGNATYTIDQSTLPTGWNVIVRSFTGATGTFVASAGTIFDAPTGLILKPLKMCSIIKDSDDNKILINHFG